MKWVRVNRAHFNASLITAFYWSMGRLYVYWQGEPDADPYDDADRKNYLGLCHCLGVKPIEEDGDGKS